jgi:hypothetical protein
MKTQNIFLLLLFYLLHSCVSEKHLEFNDVPINGSLNVFSNELIKLGFTEPQLINENQIRLNGIFLERKCEIYVYGTSKSQTVYEVRVNMPGEVRDSLEYSYERIKNIFSSKYGMGTSKYQQFRNSERFLFNEPKLIRHISPGDFTRFKTDSGEIIIEVQDGYISITFSDKLNNEIRKLETKERNKNSVAN